LDLSTVGLSEKETIMDWNHVEGSWKQVSGRVKEQPKPPSAQLRYSA
jgi:hypothetical protein